MLRGKAAALAVVAAATACGTGWVKPGPYVARAQHAVQDALEGPDFGAAAYGLERYHDFAGTYDGATVGPSLQVRWADAAGYCIEGTTASAGLEHLLGPHGRVARGPCPALL